MAKLVEIETLIKEKFYNEALIACDEMIIQKPDSLLEVCRLKAWIFSSQSNYGSAVEELVKILDSGKATIRDFDSAAFWSLYDEQLSQARDWYSIALKMGEDIKEGWFRSNELFLLGYINLRLGDLENATRFLDMLESETDESRFMIPSPKDGLVQIWDINQLRGEIRAHARSK